MNSAVQRPNYYVFFRLRLFRVWAPSLTDSGINSVCLYTHCVMRTSTFIRIKYRTRLMLGTARTAL